MKNVLLLVGLMLVLSSLGWAGACTTTSLLAYEGLGATGCSIDDKTFNDFSYTGGIGAGGAASVPASSVQVTPCNGNVGPNCVLYMPAGEEGFIFSASWNAGNPGQSIDSAISYQVTSNAGAIIDALALMQGDTVTSPGSVNISETVNNGGSLIGTLCVQNPSTSVCANPSQTITFAPVTSLIVTKDISVSAGAAGAGGSAVLSFVENGWSQIPEPRTVSMIAIGLLGLVGMARRRLLKKS